MDVAFTVVGLVLVAAVVWDVWLTVLHPDAEGVLAQVVRRGVWRAATGAGARFPAVRRRLLAAAGPVLMAGTFVVWISLLILGVALVVWSAIDRYAMMPEHGALSFLDAVYYAGGAVAVLGFGDIYPLHWPGKLLAVLAAGLGFVLLSGTTAYLIEVVSGVSTRNRFTLAVHDDTGGASGAGMLAGCLAEEGVAQARERCRAWADHLRRVDEMVHRYPLVVLTYRSRRPEYDPEPALRHVAEATVAALVAARDAPDQGLHPTARGLAAALTRLQRTIAEKYLPPAVRRQLAAPAPTAADHQAVARVRRLLAERTGAPVAAPSPADGEAAEVVYRSRVFLAGLHRWSRVAVDAYEWDG